jgi:hypothetical protein
MARAHKVDANQAEIIAAFRELGCSVHDCSGVGDGFPDLVVGLVGVNLLVECKTDGGGLTPDQERFFQEWRGLAYIIRSAQEARDLVIQTRQEIAKRGRR